MYTNPTAEMEHFFCLVFNEKFRSQLPASYEQESAGTATSVFHSYHYIQAAKQKNKKVTLWNNTFMENMINNDKEITNISPKNIGVCTLRIFHFLLNNT